MSEYTDNDRIRDAFLKDQEWQLERMMRDKDYDPECKGCEEFVTPAISGKMVLPYDVFAPRHKPSDSCKSGRRPHCTCDACF